MIVLLFYIISQSLALVTTDLKEKNEIFVNILCPSASLDFGLSRTVTGCAAKCTSVASCKSFFYNKQDKFCKGSKDIVLTAVGCEDVPNTVYYQISDCVNYGSTYTEYLNMHLNVDHIEEFFGISVSECQFHCSSSLACHGVNYSPMNGVCRLYSSTPYTNPGDFKHFTGINYYLRNCA